MKLYQSHMKILRRVALPIVVSASRNDSDVEIYSVSGINFPTVKNSLLSLFLGIFFGILSGTLFSSTLMAETAGGWVKSPENPVLGGNLGVCFDISMIRDQDEKGILYRMWFSWRTKESIAYTESRNGIQWSEPQVVLTPAGGWEERLNRPCVVQKDGKFHLWYTGQTWEESRIGYAVSADGVNWERVQTEPVMVSEQEWEKVAVMCPHVLWDAEKECFRMWYSAGEQYEPNAIGYAESKDGITWEKSALNPIFSSDADFHWERHKVTAAQVFPLDGWYVMFYIGFENENLARIGVARSRDGQTNWERLPANPIISPDAGAWDAEACYKPFVLKNEAGDGWKLWYNGRTGQVEQIGMATHTGLDLGFAKDKTPKPLPAAILNPETYRAQMEQYSANDEETVKEYVPNMAAWAYLKNTMPLLDFPDKKLENVWYFRWWTFRKHIRRIPDGTFIVTEFLPKVPWSGAENSISCPAGHHFREGRWLADPRVLSDYGRFWAKGVGRTRQYSFWLAASLWQHALATGDTATMKELLPDVIANYQAWEKSNLDPNGLFWQIDNNDGMEVSVGGSGYRATINTYMIMETTAIANIAELMLREKTETAGIAGIAETAETAETAEITGTVETAETETTLNLTQIRDEYRAKSKKLKSLLLERLWDAEDGFFKVAPRVENPTDSLTLQNVREQHGYTPWYANDAVIPPPEYTIAWKQLTDPEGFYAPFGPTTTEQRHPGFKIEYANHECQWNGPSWPYSTSITLTGLANLICRDAQADRETEELKDAFRRTLACYVNSHQRVREDGKVVPWIDENLNPYNGDWISRTRLIEWNWRASKGGYERGKDYNHSTFCDLIVNSLIGLRPSLENGFTLYPLVERDMPYFCLDRLPYHGKSVTIFYDSTGERYQRGKGLRVLVDGKEVYHADALPEKPVWVELN